MATFTAGFRAASEKVRRQHEELRCELEALEIALHRLGKSNGSALTDEVCRCGRRLAELLPEHMDHEENAVFPTAEGISPELSDFSREMRRQHEQLRARLAGFARALEALARRQEVDESLWKVCEGGVLLVQEVTDHVESEERLLDGLI
jgi:hemerythrin-like domain-containing protein